MSTISVQEVQRDPNAVLGRVEAGETLLVLRDDRPVAEIRPVTTPVQHLRPFGLCAGRFKVPAGFDAPLPEEILAEFEGS